MKTRFTSFIARAAMMLLTVSALTAQAQDAKQTIRQRYADIKAQIQQMEESEKSGTIIISGGISPTLLGKPQLTPTS